MVDVDDISQRPCKLRGTAYLMKYAITARKPTQADLVGTALRGTPYGENTLADFIPPSQGDFRFLRFTDTPFGPYNEIAFLPGSFKNPVKPKKRYGRITAIYLDLPAALNYGRSVFGHPKRLASFTFDPPNPNPYTEFKLTVSMPSAPSTLIFSCTITQMLPSFVPSFPLNTRFYLPPSTILLHPPLAAENAEELVGLDAWSYCDAINWKGKLRLVRVKGELEGGKFMDGEYLPSIEPWSVAFFLDDFEMEMPVARRLFSNQNGSEQNAKTK